MARRGAQLPRNMKNLSIAIPTLRPSPNEQPSPSAPYADGPLPILPGIWLGSEHNARDWTTLVHRGITTILNVAKEVTLPFDLIHPSADPTYYPPHMPSGRPAIHYLKLHWSHGQQNLADEGFSQAMAFTDAALQRGDGVLIHCQCGISRSATLAIALVMRAAAERASNVPPEVWSLQDMHGAYAYVKEKSKWISPNMSLIYQLLEYQKKLGNHSRLEGCSDPALSFLAGDERWRQQRRLFDEIPPVNDHDRESIMAMHEAQALDKAMEDSVIARGSSNSSLSSSNSSHGMGHTWGSRYSSRKRASSVASSRTNGSFLSENLVEEDEEAELLGVGGGFDSEKNTEESSSTTSQDDDMDVHRRPTLVPFATKRTFYAPSSTVRLPRPRLRRRPPPIGLPPVPSSPVTLIMDISEASATTATISKPPSPRLSVSTPVQRLIEPPHDSRKHTSSLHLRSSVLRSTRGLQNPLALPSSQANTPSQTLFVFPPSPTAVRTPSTLMITSTPNVSSMHFPPMSTPRASTSRSHGRPQSFIGIGIPATPTTAFTKLNVRGYVGIQC